MTWMQADLPIQWLYAFVIFADANSMQLAATQLGVTQPALSKQLKALELRLPQKIFAQDGKRKVLTAFGQDLHARLKLRLADLPDLVRQTGQLHSDAKAAQVRLSARREVLDRIAPRLMWPGKIVFVESRHTEILSALRNRQVDLGITYDAPVSNQLIARPLFKESFQFVIPKSLTGKNLSEAEVLATLPALPCVAYREKDEILETACRSKNIDPATLNIVRVSGNYRSLAALIENEIGWGVIPSRSDLSSGKHWIFKLNSRSVETRDFQLIYRQELRQAPWMKELLAQISGVFARH